MVVGGAALIALTRSLLVFLLATCDQTLLALDAASTVLDTDMTEDLRRKISRTQAELAVMDDKPLNKLAAAPA